MKTLPPRLIAAAVLALFATALVINAGPWPSFARFAGGYVKPHNYPGQKIAVSPQQLQSTFDESSLKSGAYFTIYRNDQGEAVCRASTVAEVRQLEVNTRELRLRPINHPELFSTQSQQEPLAAGSGLTIILRATQQLQQNPTAVTAFTRAAQNWEALVMSPVTIYIDVDFGTTFFGQTFPSGVLGATSAPDGSYPYDSARTNLVAEANGEGNVTKQAVFDALPSTTVPTDLGTSGSTVVSDPTARAIGLLPPTAASADPAAKIGFNSNFTFDFDPSDGITSGQLDFDAVATHEIGHALGFHSEAGLNLPRPAVLDLYRFRTGTSTGTFTNAQRLVTIGGSPDPLQFFFVPGNNELGLSTGGTSGSFANGGDGWQSSHWKHATICSPYIGIMDPAIGSGCRRTITSNDTLALSYFGYNLTNNNAPPPPPPTPTPPANDNFANAQMISGCSGTVAGSSFSATSEAGEPSHDPPDSLSLSPGHTVWYQWQPSSSGSTTITTAGSEFDTILAVYTGSSVGSLTRIVFNDDVQSGTLTSSVTFTANGGTTYQIVIDGWGGDVGGVKLNWNGCPGPTPTPTPSPTATPIPSPTATPIPTPTPSPAPGGVRQISLAAKDLVYDPVHQRIFASVPSSAGAIGNSITAIDPFNGTVGASVFIGSEPGKLAIADTFQYIYASLDGAAAVRRFDLNSQTAGLQFALGSDSFFGALYVEDMAVVPGQPDSVAISRKYQSVSPRHAGVAIYDNGTARTTTTPTHTGSNVIEFSSSPSTLYGYNNETTEFGFRRMAVTTSGVSVVATNSNVISGFGVDIRYDNGLVYSTTGKVINPETATQVGSFAGLGFGWLVLPDSSSNRVYFLGPSGSSTLTLKAFDQTTFIQTGSLSITGVSGDAGSLIKWGADGLAFRTTGNQIFLIALSSIVPTPPSPIPTPVPVAGGIVRLPLATNDIVYDPFTQRVFASLPGSAGTFGNSIAKLAPQTATMETSVFVGSEPSKLAISDNGQYIYAGLDGSASVRRFDVASSAAGLQFALGMSQFNGPMYVEDLATLPGNPNAVAISRRNVGFSPRHEGVGVYDDGVARSVTTASHTGSNVIEFSGSASTLYGYNNETTEFGLRKMAVTASGVSVTATYSSVISGFGIDIRFDNGLIYTTSGKVVNPETGQLLGSFTGASGLVVPDSAASRIYYLTGLGSSTLTLKTYDPNTFSQTGALTISGVSGTPGSFIKCGSNLLAFRTETQLYFVSISAIVPIPPTPLPVPVNLGNGIIQLPLAANDLVYDSATAKVYASVPSSAGTFGNSLAPINPFTGVVSTPVFIGSEPRKLAISGNNQFIYTGFDGIAAARRFDLATQTAGLQFALGNSSFNGALYVEDIAVMPGDPNAVAISRRNVGFSPRHEGVAIYDSGVMRLTTTPTHTGSNVIEFSSNAATLYGYNNETTDFGLRKMAVTSSGVSVTTTNSNVISGFGVDIKYDNGKVYASSGRVVDPETGTLVGTYSGVSSLAFVPDSRVQRVYFVTGSGSSATLQAFDQNTFVPVGSLAIPGVSGSAMNLIRWGSNGLAFRTSGNQIYFIQTSLIPPIAPQLMIDANNHVVAIDSVTFVREPFSAVSTHNFSTDQRTRITIFTSDLGLTQPTPNLSVTAGGIPLSIEAVGPLTTVPNTSYIIVKLDPMLTGNVQLSVTFGGATSNPGVLSISP